MIFRLDDHKDQAGAWDVLEAAQGELAYDIGANVGQSTKVLSAGFKKVIAFEPCLESWEILQVEAPANVLPIMLAVSSVDGEIVLEEHSVSIGTGQLTKGDGLHWGHKVGSRVVPSLTLDTLVNHYGMPDFVKIDTEGSEVEIVRGGMKTLAEVEHLIIEVHHAGNEKPIRGMLPMHHFKKLEHNMRISSPIRQNHFWLVSRGA